MVGRRHGRHSDESDETTATNIKIVACVRIDLISSKKKKLPTPTHVQRRRLELLIVVVEGFVDRSIMFPDDRRTGANVEKDVRVQSYY